MKKILEKIRERKKILEKIEYPRKNEIDYLDQFGVMIDSMYSRKNIVGFNVEDLFLICYMAYNQDDDFEKIRNLVMSSKTLLNEIIEDMDKIKGSIFKDEKFIETINRLNILYRRKKIFVLSQSKSLKSEFLKNEKQFDNITSTIRSYYIKMIKFNNKCVIGMMQEYTALENLYNFLTNELKLPISINKKLIENIGDDLIFDLYKRTLELNQEYYYEFCNKKNQIASNEQQIKKHQLSLTGYDVTKIDNASLNFILKYGDINKIIKIIEFIKQIDYKMFDMYSNNGIYILINTDYETLYILNELLKKNIINLTFLNENPEVFFNKDVLSKVEGTSNKLLNNVDLLIKNYDLENTYINELLLKENRELENNVNLLKKYSNDFNKCILNNSKLVDYIDLFIELGLGRFIASNVKLINENSMNLIKRIYVSKLLDIKIIENNSINTKILYSHNFYVPNELLDEYIINNTNDYIDNNIKNILDNNIRNIIIENEPVELLNFKKDNLTYDFDGILISRNKVLRNLNCLIDSKCIENNEQMFLSSIIYGSILDKEQIEKIRNLLFSKKYTK